MRQIVRSRARFYCRFVGVSMPGRYKRLGVGVRLGSSKGTVEAAVVALTSRPRGVRACCEPYVMKVYGSQAAAPT